MSLESRPDLTEGERHWGSWHYHLTTVWSLCLVNYRGSTGFGQDSILSLPGNVGHQDVQDVQVADWGSEEALGGPQDVAALNG